MVLWLLALHNFIRDACVMGLPLDKHAYATSVALYSVVCTLKYLPGLFWCILTTFIWWHTFPELTSCLENVA